MITQIKMTESKKTRILLSLKQEVKHAVDNDSDPVYTGAEP